MTRGTAVKNATPRPAPRLRLFDDDTPELLFLHSVALDSNVFEPMARRLAGQVSSAGIDLPGHGLSPAWPGQWQLPDLADGIAETMRARLTAPVVVAGLSLGGMVAQHLALRHPDLVRGLVLIDTNYRQQEASRANMLARASACTHPVDDQELDGTMRRWFSDGYRASHPESVDAARQQLRGADRRVQQQCWTAIAGLDVGERLREIAVPALVLCGTRDISTPMTTAAEMTALLPRGRLRQLDGAGHLSIQEQPAQAAQIVGDFVCSLHDIPAGYSTGDLR